MIATGVGLASVLPGIDGDALIGAFAGGALFVVSAAKQPLLARLIYFPVSVIAGYQLAPEILRWLPIVQWRGRLRQRGVRHHGDAGPDRKEQVL